jgi:hypothetical protein
MMPKAWAYVVYSLSRTRAYRQQKPERKRCRKRKNNRLQTIFSTGNKLVGARLRLECVECVFQLNFLMACGRVERAIRNNTPGGKQAYKGTRRQVIV